MLLGSVDYWFDLFRRDALPQLLYITKQEIGPAFLSRPPHSHNEICEIMLIQSGFGVYRSGIHAFAVQKGDVIFCNPGIQHEMAVTPGQNATIYCFGLTGFQRPSLSKNQIIPLNESFIRSSDIYFSVLCELSESLFFSLGSKTDRPSDALPILFSSFLSLVLTLKPTSANLSHNRDEFILVERVQHYIDTNYVQNFTLEDIAQRFHCSASYISHIFKNIIGYSPMQYKTRCRIGLAQSLLISSNMTSTQIATMVGYDNTNYFNTVFSKMVGVSPIRYRKQYLMQNMRGIRVQ